MVEWSTPSGGVMLLLSLHASPCEQRLIGVNFLLKQNNDPKHSTKLFKTYLRDEAVRWTGVCSEQILCLLDRCETIKPNQLVGGA